MWSKWTKIQYHLKHKFIFRNSTACVQCCTMRYALKVFGSMTTLNWVGRLLCLALLKNTPAVSSERLTVPEEPPEPCDFGVNVENLDMCTWLIPTNASERSKWRLGMGELSAWIGGPRADHTTSDKIGQWTCYLSTTDLELCGLVQELVNSIFN